MRIIQHGEKPNAEFAKFADQFYQSLENGESYAQRVRKFIRVGGGLK